MKFTIGIFKREIDPHTACFEDFAFALRDALRAIGHEVVPFGPDGRPIGRLICFGGNNAAHDTKLAAADAVRYGMPEDAIIFNTEQLAAVDHPERFMQGHEQYRHHVVWDYSLANIEALKKLGIERAVHCPLGYIESMTTITNKPVEEQDVDVLFYGSTNPHRLKVLDGLDKAGIQVARLFGIYGKKRDEWIARSKVVLNMHHYERGVFEIFRVSHLVANKKCVVSELGGVDDQLNALASELTWDSPYELLVESCQRLVRDREEREAVARSAFSYFRGMRLTDFVARALEQS